MSRLSAPAIWETRNLAVASAGALGFVLPPGWALLSGAPAYNLFHIAAGLAGIGLVLGPGAEARSGSTWGSG